VRDPKVRPTRPHGRRAADCLPHHIFDALVCLFVAPSTIPRSGPPTRLTRPIASPSPSLPSPYSIDSRGATCSHGRRCRTRTCSRARARAPAASPSSRRRPGCPRGGGKTRPASQQAPGSPPATPPPASASRRRRRSHHRSSYRRDLRPGLTIFYAEEGTTVPLASKPWRLTVKSTPSRAGPTPRTG
jgi:hypothetical protein